MVRCDVQRWNMQKQIDATRYIVPYKTDDRMSIIVLRYAHCITRSSYTVTSLRVTLSRDFSPERHPAIRHTHVKKFVKSWAVHDVQCCSDASIPCNYLPVHTLHFIRDPAMTHTTYINLRLNPSNPELNPICYLLALLGDHHFLHISKIRVKLLTFRLLMSYIYGAPILDVSRSHTTTQHSR